MASSKEGSLERMEMEGTPRIVVGPASCASGKLFLSGAATANAVLVASLEAMLRETGEVTRTAGTDEEELGGGSRTCFSLLHFAKFFFFAN